MSLGTSYPFGSCRQIFFLRHFAFFRVSESLLHWNFMFLSSRVFSSFCVCTLSIAWAPPISSVKCRSLLFSFSLCSCPSGNPCRELLPVLFQSLNSSRLSQKLCHVSTINKYLFLKLMGSVPFFLCSAWKFESCAWWEIPLQHLFWGHAFKSLSMDVALPC